MNVRARHVWILFSLTLVVRDLWLLAGGGGVAPQWMLRVETLAFGVSALGGLALSKSPARPSTTLRVAAAASGSMAVAMHGIRLFLYLRGRPR